jgi:hypothetical protein
MSTRSDNWCRHCIVKVAEQHKYADAAARTGMRPLCKGPKEAEMSLKTYSLDMTESYLLRHEQRIDPKRTGSSLHPTLSL